MPSTLLQPVNANTWFTEGFAASFTTMGGSTTPVPLPCPTHPIVTRAAVVLAGALRLIAYRYPFQSPIKIRLVTSSTMGSVSTLLEPLVQTVTGQFASETKVGAPPPKTGEILYNLPSSVPTYALSVL